MPTDPLVTRSPMPVPAAALAGWHFRPGAFQRLTPPWEDAVVVHATGPFADGTRWTIRSRLLGPVKLDWVAELFDVRPGTGFRDRQISGPFAEWEHTHRFLPDTDSTSVLEDDIRYRVPLGMLGKLAAGRSVRRRLERMFAFRHARTAADLRRHAAYTGPPLAVAVTGSRGLIGSELIPFLTAGGHRVIRFDRKPQPPKFDDGTTSVEWQPDAPTDPKRLEGVDAVIHLAGEGVADGRWTKAKMARIRSSRVGPTRLLAEAAASAGVPVFLSGSAIGFYGPRDEPVTESSPPGTGFLADVTKEWEAAAEPFARRGRLVLLRTGIVLSAKGGALAKQLPAFRAGGGAVLGDGTQPTSWIGIDDWVSAAFHALSRPDVSGPLNLTAPTPVTNREFARTLVRALNRPLLLTVPGAAVRLMFGKMADEALLTGAAVTPAKLTTTGFGFDRPTLEAELRWLLGR